MKLLVFWFSTAVMGLRLNPESPKLSSLLSLVASPRNDSRIPFPPNLDYSRLYCYEESGTIQPATVSTSLIQESSLVSTCSSDSDCATNPYTVYCVSGLCKECRSVVDCPVSTSTALMCSVETEFSCSECGNDNDCPGTQICRLVYDVNVSRKRCAACSSTDVPVEAILSSTSSCSWQCRGGQIVGPSGQCEPCPQCMDGQMMIPSQEFGLAQPLSFFPQCNMATSPKCVDCPGKDNECAIQLSPTSDWSNDVSVGFLPMQYPCPAFRCKQGWWLDKTKNQCRMCEYRSCGVGKQLVNCFGISPGQCADCPTQGVDPTIIGFINPQDVSYSVTTGMDVCKPACPPNTYLMKPQPSYPWYCAQCPTNQQCPPGYFYTGCGPQESLGQCQLCATATLPATYWTPGGGCTLTVCDPNQCVPGTKLVGCGGDSPGKCVGCPNSLPSNAVGYISLFDEITMGRDTCGIQCEEGYFLQRQPTTDLNSIFTCVSCSDTTRCALGQQLDSCGGEDPGQCISCPPLPDGKYYSNSTGIACSSSDCPINNPCPPGQTFKNCGGVNAGECVRS
jgi:hypothetical protein